MAVYVSVGYQVVGGFNTVAGALKCIRQIAPACNPKLKKCHPIPTEKRVAKHCSNEARQVEIYKRYPRTLKPGEFTL